MVLYGSQFFGGPVKYVLSGSGHIAGVVNPPASNKYQYWTNDNVKSANVAEWMKGAVEHKGSWWPDWRQWLGDRSRGSPGPHGRQRGVSPDRGRTRQLCQGSRIAESFALSYKLHACGRN